MNILIFGDIIGKPGRSAIVKTITALKEEHKIDFTIANGENLAHGAGVTEKTLNEIVNAGVDFVTSGDHIWDKRNVIEMLNNTEIPLLRPANYPPCNAGAEYKIIKTGNCKIAIVNLIGRVFIKGSLDCPFRKINHLLDEIKNKTCIIIVDFHAEATSEKKAMGIYLNGKVTVVFGTHTHVPTCDYEILSDGTAYVTDVGMTGPKDSIIGVDKHCSLDHFLTQMPFEYQIAESKIAEVNCIVVNIDEKSGKALKIEMIRKNAEI